MPQTAFEISARPTLITDDGHKIVPVNRIFCVGQNYAEHIREMGKDPAQEAPIFFSKPVTAIVHHGATIPYPQATENLHHEAELSVILGSGGRDVSVGDATSLVWGFAASNDLTRRDLQAQAKAKGRPWDMAKGFDHSAVFGAVSEGSIVPDGEIRCFVGEDLRQSSPLSNMIWSVPEIIAHLSRLVTLQTGDVIMTGTPSGVGPLNTGETCRVEVDGLASASVTIA